MMRLLPMEPPFLREVVALEAEIAHSPWSAEMIQEESRLGAWLRVLVAGERTVAGYAVARPLFDEWHLLTLGVAPRFRRQGLGRQLVEALLVEAVAQGANDVVLEVRVSNVPARLLYQGVGFVTIGVRRGYYRHGPFGPEDALVMSRPTRLPESSGGSHKIFLA